MVDMPKIEDMLRDYECRLRQECDGRLAALNALPKASSREDRIRRVAEIEALIVLEERREGVACAYLELREERQAKLIARFAGPPVPAAPLDLVAFATTLLDDWDDPDLSGYIGALEDWEDREEPEPISDAFDRAHEAELALRPVTPEAATAIVIAADRDAAKGYVLGWDRRKVGRARKLAMPSIPRAR